MENEILTKIEEQNKKIDSILIAVEKTNKYLLISMWVTIIMLILPLVIGAIVIPALINTYLGTFEGLI